MEDIKLPTAVKNDCLGTFVNNDAYLLKLQFNIHQKYGTDFVGCIHYPMVLEIYCPSDEFKTDGLLSMFDLDDTIELVNNGYIVEKLQIFILLLKIELDGDKIICENSTYKIPLKFTSWKSGIICSKDENDKLDIIINVLKAKKTPEKMNRLIASCSNFRITYNGYIRDENFNSCEGYKSMPVRLNNMLTFNHGSDKIKSDKKSELFKHLETFEQVYCERTLTNGVCFNVNNICNLFFYFKPADLTDDVPAFNSVKLKINGKDILSLTENTMITYCINQLKVYNISIPLGLFPNKFFRESETIRKSLINNICELVFEGNSTFCQLLQQFGTKSRHILPTIFAEKTEMMSVSGAIYC